MVPEARAAHAEKRVTRVLRDGDAGWRPGADAILVVALFVGLALLYSVVTPVFEGFDEVWHYAFVQHVASGQGLPRQPAAQCCSSRSDSRSASCRAPPGGVRSPTGACRSAGT